MAEIRYNRANELFIMRGGNTLHLTGTRVEYTDDRTEVEICGLDVTETADYGYSYCTVTAHEWESRTRTAR